MNKQTNFAVKVSDNSIVVENLTNGTKVGVVYDKSSKTLSRIKEVPDHSESHKDNQYGGYINVVLSDLIKNKFPKSLSYKARFNKIAKVMESSLTANSVRHFSNNFRKSVNGNLVPLETYFHEGKMVKA